MTGSESVPLSQMLALYKALGWRQHLYPDRVARALAASTRVVTAWDGDRLVGMARMVSDGEFCVDLRFKPVDGKLGYQAMTKHGPH